MGFRINTNIAAMNAHGNSIMNNRNLDDSLAKLSSGLRINKAADDAAGLVIANSLRNQANSLGQAVSNGNDAIGLIQTADGALSEYSKILDTIKTKSVQAASDGQNTASRLAIQKDIGRLMEELNVIAKTTSFNGQKLLSGTFTNKEFQMGANANETIKANIASAETSQIGQTSRADLNIGQMGVNQLTLKSATTGKTITLESVNIQANNNPANGMGALADQLNKNSAETGITAKAVVSATTSTAIAAGTTGSDFAINGINIGSVNVSANDADGALLSAINGKATQTGVSATKTADGKIALATSDGRAISVTGDMSTVMGTSADAMSTIGKLEVVQAGSSTFQITGAKTGTAVGEDMTTTGTMTTIQDSVLQVASTMLTDSKIAGGSKLGADLTASLAFALTSSTKDAIMLAGSTIGSSSKLEHGTVLGAKITTDVTVTLTSDMFITKGSVLGSSTVFDAGTVLKQDFTVAGVLYKAGTTLTVDLTLSSARTLSQDMTMTIDIQNQNAALGSGSKLMIGTVLGEDITVASSTTTSVDMVLKAGTSLLSDSTFKAGSTIADDILVTGTLTMTSEMTLKAGSVVNSGSLLKEGSTIGGELKTRAAITLNQDMVVKAGSTLATATVLKAGTVLNQDLTDAQVGGGTGSGLAKGTILGTDVTLTAAVNVTSDFTMLKGTSGTNGSLAAGSVLAANGGASQNSVTMTNEVFSNLSSIDVTTFEGATKALDTVDAAISNLDTIRSDLGSVQNQIVATINNISVTQVNVKAAESQLRDVDFAAESANFSKFNILAQSGSYAMSQANAVQQNVLRLLQ